MQSSERNHGTDSDHPLGQRLQLTDALFGFIHLLQDGNTAFIVISAGFGQSQAAGATVEQFGAQPGFEFGDVLADGGLGTVDLLGDSRKAPRSTTRTNIDMAEGRSIMLPIPS
jgi:hypothetical protein